MNRIGLVGIGLLAVMMPTLTASAAEVMWVEIKPVLSYRDLSTSCSTESFPMKMYFGAEVAGGKVQAAVITRELPINALTKHISFTPDEVKGLDISRDSERRSWVKRLTLDSRLIVWFLHYSAFGELNPCAPSMKLSSLEPLTATYDFPVEGMPVVPITVTAPLSRFQGRRVDGSLYEASLYFTQRQLPPSQP